MKYRQSYLAIILFVFASCVGIAGAKNTEAPSMRQELNGKFLIGCAVNVNQVNGEDSVGSAIIAYAVYVFIIIGLYYVSFYKKLLGLSRKKLFLDFLHPTLIAMVSLLLCLLIPFEEISFWSNNRFYHLAMLFIKAVCWFIPYVIMIFAFKLVTVKEIKNAR